MSQRTRGRTTGAAPHSPPKASAPAPRETPATEPTPAGGLPIQPEALARTLRAVADEIERNPELARRVTAAMASSSPPAGRPAEHQPRIDEPDASSEARPVRRKVNAAFRPRLITGAAPDLGPGIPDPFALRKGLGDAGLRAALDGLRLGSLRAIIREHGLDPSGRLARQNDAAKLREAILQAVIGNQR